MIPTKLFGEELKARGFDFYSGVPCSFLKHLINYAINECEYVMAANEGDAVATCAGAYLGGRKSVFLCQNSGLTNATSPLTSLNHVFQIPVLGFVSLRGEPGLSDEPQHELMGRITTSMLDLMGLPWEFLSDDFEMAKQQIRRADDWIRKSKSFFFVVRKGTFQEERLKAQPLRTTGNREAKGKSGSDALPSRAQVLETLSQLKDPDSVLLATTGKTGRELYEVGDAENNLYMVGSMGCISSLGLGLALTQKRKKIVAIDGDGALLMRMGSMATVAYYNPSNMLHVLLDNNTHDSTGGQATVSHNIDFVRAAAAMGYANCFYVHNLRELKDFVACWQANGTLTFLHMKIKPGSLENLGRPGIKPHEVKNRLMNFLSVSL